MPIIKEDKASGAEREDRESDTHSLATRGVAKAGSGLPRRDRPQVPRPHSDRPPRRPEPAPPGDRRAKKKAEAGEIVLLSQDEARFPMVPTLQATLGVKGHRPKVGTRDCKDLLYVFAVVNLVSAALHANTLESPKGATKKTG